jgi:hypothetical protein
MFSLGIGLAGLAYLLAYSAWTGSSVTDELSALVRGERSPGKALAESRSTTSTNPFEGLTLGGVGSPAPDPSVPSPTSASNNATDSTGRPITLVSIGQSGHRLQPDTAAAFKRAETRFGGTIKITDSYRSRAQQADCHRRKPTICAAAGKSDHEDGDAVDVVDSANGKLIQALMDEGFVRARCDSDGCDEPWHFSRGRESGRRSKR